MDDSFLEYLHGSLGVTHVWYTGIIRHASGQDWTKGEAGSPYAIEDYFDVNPYLADNQDDRLNEFRQLVERTHGKGMKVLIDFVPNHVARNCTSYFGAEDDKSVHWRAENDFFYYPGEKLRLPFNSSYEEDPAKASGNAFTACPDINDWYDTIKLNYCQFHTATWDKMLKVLKYWKSMGVDGFRCDMVELVPREAISYLISETRKEYPDTIFIAEVYERSGYEYYYKEAGFDALYDKCGLYDCLYSIVRNNVAGEYPESSAKDITANWKFLGNLQDGMLNFLENHDEVRLAGPLFARDVNNSYAALYVSLLFNTAPFMLYFGQEVGEYEQRTTIFDWNKPESVYELSSYIQGIASMSYWRHEVLQKYKDLLAYAGKDIIRLGGTYDLMYCNQDGNLDTDRHFAFLRAWKGDINLIVVNFSSSDATVEVNIPSEAFAWAGRPDEGSRKVTVSVLAGDGTIIRNI